MKILLFCFLIKSCLSINYNLLEVEDRIYKYFQSDTVKSFNEHWSKVKLSYENAIALALRDNFGRKNMNLFLPEGNRDNPLNKGFLFKDKSVTVVLTEMFFRYKPTVISPTVHFSPPNNYLRVEAKLSKMVIDTSYILCRNKSDIFYGEAKEGDERSPFTFQQVQNTGNFTIIADECNLVTSSITSLMGQSVNLGTTRVEVQNCRINIEIYKPGMGSPPVMLPYSFGEAFQLDRIIARAVTEEVIPKLQAILFSYVNTSAIFGDDLMKIRHEQSKIFKDSSEYVSKMISNMNSLTMEWNRAVKKMPNSEITWDDWDTFGKTGSVTTIRVANVKVCGLDSAYSSAQGGPFKYNVPKIGENVKYNSLQITGEATFKNKTCNSTFVFAVEIRDAIIEVQLKVDASHSAEHGVGGSNIFVGKTVNKIGMFNCRSIEFSMPEMNNIPGARLATHSFVTGYILNKLPKLLFNHIIDSVPAAIDRTEGKPDKPPPKESNSEYSMETDFKNEEKSDIGNEQSVEESKDRSQDIGEEGFPQK